jgi:hypothetical protein
MTYILIKAEINLKKNASKASGKCSGREIRIYKFLN